MIPPFKTKPVNLPGSSRYACCPLWPVNCAVGFGLGPSQSYRQRGSSRYLTSNSSAAWCLSYLIAWTAKAGLTKWKITSICSSFASRCCQTWTKNQCIILISTSCQTACRRHWWPYLPCLGCLGSTQCASCCAMESASSYSGLWIMGILSVTDK